MFIRNDNNVIHRDELVETLFPESVWCSISCRGERLLIGVCYRPPDSLEINNEALFSLLNRVSKEKAICMGDFNWSVEAENISESHPFVECINNNFLIQVVLEPTRGINFLDLILCSEEDMITDL